MLQYPWPGNVRELENELKRLVALGVRRIKLSDLAPGILSPNPAPGGRNADASMSSGGGLPTLNLRQIERVAIEKAIEEAGGNKTQAAKILGLSRRGLLKKLERYKIAGGSEDTQEGVIDGLLESNEGPLPEEG